MRHARTLVGIAVSALFLWLLLAQVDRDELVDAVAGAGARVVAGRIFRLSEGVWRDVSHPDAGAVVKVKAYSAAYFRVLRALPELEPVLRELNPVLVAGGAVAVQVGDEGAETLTEAQMKDLVTRFRQAPRTP